jgi:hypothetical protein
MLPTKNLDLFAGIPVTNFAEARKWYMRLLGSPPTFMAHDTEAVWELAEHRFVYILEEPNQAGHARLTLFVEDLEAIVAGIGERGLESRNRESYPNGVQKITYLDPDGNEIGFGGAPKRRVRQPVRSGRKARSSKR